MRFLVGSGVGDGRGFCWSRGASPRGWAGGWAGPSGGGGRALRGLKRRLHVPEPSAALCEAPGAGAGGSEAVAGPGFGAGGALEIWGAAGGGCRESVENPAGLSEPGSSWESWWRRT